MILDRTLQGLKMRAVKDATLCRFRPAMSSASGFKKRSFLLCKPLLNIGFIVTYR